MADIKEIAEQLVNLTIKEVTDLTKFLEEEYGIKPAAAAAPVMMAGPGGGDGGDAGPAEQTEFDVILNSAGAAKLKVVKEIKGLLGLGLKDAKSLVDGAPTPVKEKISKEEAEELKKALEAVGAEVELK